jgi:hypothetical protein
MPPCFALSSVSYPHTRFRTDLAPSTSWLLDPFSHVSIRRTDCTSLMDSEKERREAPESASSSGERLRCSSDEAKTPKRSEWCQRGEDGRREIGGRERRNAQRNRPRRGQWWRRQTQDRNSLRVRRHRRVRCRDIPLEDSRASKRRLRRATPGRAQFTSAARTPAPRTPPSGRGSRSPPGGTCRPSSLARSPRLPGTLRAGSTTASRYPA